MIDGTNCEEYLDILDATYNFICGFHNYLKSLISKIAKLRDLGDDMVTSLNEFLSKNDLRTETNLEFCRKYRQLSQCLSIVEDNRDAKIERLENRLSKSFGSLIEFLKLTRSKYKRLYSIYKKEINQQYKNNERINSSDQEEVMDIKAKLINLIENFEKEKNQTFDKIFKDFILINLSFCTEAAHVYTNGYRSLCSSENKFFDQSLNQMTKSLYQHNFESTVMEMTNRFGKLNVPEKAPKGISHLSSDSFLNYSTYSENINKNKDIKATASSHSIFGMIKLSENSEDGMLDQSSTDNSSEEEDSYETKKRKARLEFLQSLTETEV